MAQSRLKGLLNIPRDPRTEVDKGHGVCLNYQLGCDLWSQPNQVEGTKDTQSTGKGIITRPTLSESNTNPRLGTLKEPSFSFRPKDGALKQIYVVKVFDKVLTYSKLHNNPVKSWLYLKKALH